MPQGECTCGLICTLCSAVHYMSADVPCSTRRLWIILYTRLPLFRLCVLWNSVSCHWVCTSVTETSLCASIVLSDSRDWESHCMWIMQVLKQFLFYFGISRFNKKKTQVLIRQHLSPNFAILNFSAKLKEWENLLLLKIIKLFNNSLGLAGKCIVMVFTAHWRYKHTTYYTTVYKIVKISSTVNIYSSKMQQ